MTDIVRTPLLMRLRKLWFQIHKWIALALMVLLIPLGLSGIVLTWDDAIDHALNPRRYAAHGPARLPPSAYAAAARAAIAPGDRIAMIRYPDPDGPVTVSAVSPPRDKGQGKRPRGMPARATVWLDPGDGHALDRQSGDSGLIRIAHNFHGSLFVPGVGRALVGLLGVVMFLLAASGLWLWWPPRGRWTRGFRWRRGDRKLDTNLHHMFGFWIAIPLAAQAVTGVWIASPQMIALVTGGGFGGGGRMRAQPLETPAMTPEAALAAASKIASGKPAAITWPAGEDGPWRISLDTAKGPIDVTVDDIDGTAEIAHRRDGGLAMVMRRFHDGTTLGFYWRMVMVLIGLAPTVMGVTGLLMWLRGRRWRKRPAKARQAA
ncbi:MAG TPA: PepSY-associated TM helix domain-containing protein [Sphingomonas sp.]